MHLLDTDFCIDWLRRKDYARAALAKVAPADVAVSSVTVGELLMGAHCGVMAEAQKVLAFLSPIQILPFGQEEATRYGEVAGRLRKEGQSIGVADAMIAATAIVQGLTVVTNNTRHYERVKGLKCTSWAPKVKKAIGEQ